MKKPTKRKVSTTRQPATRPVLVTTAHRGVFFGYGYGDGGYGYGGGNGSGHGYGT